MPTTKFIWDDENCLAEADGSNTINTVYTNEPQQYGNLVSSRISAATSYHHFDAIGSTRQLTNAAGGTTDTMIYDAWGGTVVRTGTTAVNLQWIGALGYYLDQELGTQYVRRRFYLPKISRWTSADSDDFSLFPLINRYRIVRGSPMRFVDPSGLLPVAGANVEPEGIAVKLSRKKCNACGYIDWHWEYDAEESGELTNFIVIQRVCLFGRYTICLLDDEDCCVPRVPRTVDCCFFENLGIVDTTTKQKAGDDWRGAGERNLVRDCLQAGFHVREADVRGYDRRHKDVVKDVSDPNKWHQVPSPRVQCGDITVGAGNWTQDEPDWWDDFDAQTHVAGFVVWRCCPGKEVGAIAIWAPNNAEAIPCK